MGVFALVCEISCSSSCLFLMPLLFLVNSKFHCQGKYQDAFLLHFLLEVLWFHILTFIFFLMVQFCFFCLCIYKQLSQYYLFERVSFSYLVILLKISWWYVCFLSFLICSTGLCVSFYASTILFLLLHLCNNDLKFGISVLVQESCFSDFVFSAYSCWWI